MMPNELQVLEENRQEGETLNATRFRLLQEKKLMSLSSQEQRETGTRKDEEGFQESDLVIPRWKVVQPTSRMNGATVGRFRNMLTGEERERLENVLFLKRQNGRVLFPDNDFSGQRLCWSYDGLVPATSEIITQTSAQPKAHACATGLNGQRIVHCPFAQWSEKNGHDKAAPPCKETINFLGLENFLPFFLSFHGTAIPVVKKLISSIYLKKKHAAVHGKQVHLRDFRLTIGLTLEINDKGKFYLPSFENITEIVAEEERAVLTQCFVSLQQRTMAEALEAEEVNRTPW